MTGKRTRSRTDSVLRKLVDATRLAELASASFEDLLACVAYADESSLGADAFLAYVRYRADLAGKAGRFSLSQLPPRLKRIQGQPPPGFPFVALPRTGDELPPVGYVRVESIGGSEHRFANAREDLVEAVRSAIDWFKEIDPRISDAVAWLDLDFREWTGKSAALSALLAAVLLSLRRRTAPFGAVASGGISSDGKRLLPIASKQLRAKIEIAARYGFSHMYVVQDGAGITSGGKRKIEPQGIELRCLSPDPRRAILDFLEFLGPEDGRRATQDLIYLFDRVCMHDVERTWSENERVISTLEQFRSVQDPVARALATFGLSKAYARSADSARAVELDRAVAKDLQACAASGGLILSTAIEFHLRVDRIAHCAILAIDSGEWKQEGHPSWEQLHRELHEARDDANRDKQLDPKGHLARMYLENVESRLIEYKARVCRDTKAIIGEARRRVVWLRRIGDLATYAFDHLGRSDTTVERQQNFIMDALFAAWVLGAPRDRLDLVDSIPWFFKDGSGSIPTSLTDPRFGNDFDRHSLLKYWLITGAMTGMPKLEVQCQRWIEGSGKMASSSPTRTAILETLCLHHPNAGIRRLAARRLSRGLLRIASPPSKPVLADLLALRTRAAIALGTRRVALRSIREQLAEWRDCPLTRLARRIAKSARSLKDFAVRLPY